MGDVEHLAIFQIRLKIGSHDDIDRSCVQGCDGGKLSDVLGKKARELKPLNKTLLVLVHLFQLRGLLMSMMGRRKVPGRLIVDVDFMT